MENETVREEQKERLAALREALIQGENSGPPAPFDFDALIATKLEAASLRSKRPS